MTKYNYNIENKFLYEILDDYRNSDEFSKDEIFNSFMNQIWQSKNTRQIYTKYIKFSVLSNLVETDIGKIFYDFTNIPYFASKSLTKNKNYISLIRQKINNLYNNYCEKRLCTRRDYLNLLKMPKTLYFRWESGEQLDSIALREELNNYVSQAQTLKNQYSKQKMNLTWKEFKPVIEKYLRRCFENYISLDEYENKDTYVIDTDIWCEDNFYIKYICDSMQLGLKNYQKEYYGVKRNKNYIRCLGCGTLIEKTNNRVKFCKPCAKINKNNLNKTYKGK